MGKLYNTNLYGKRKPCHELKRPREHEWGVETSLSYRDAIEVTIVCSRCRWGFDIDYQWASELPTDDTLFKEHLDD